jgi:hypothetical protein
MGIEIRSLVGYAPEGASAGDCVTAPAGIAYSESGELRHQWITDDRRFAVRLRNAPPVKPGCSWCQTHYRGRVQARPEDAGAAEGALTSLHL